MINRIFLSFIIYLLSSFSVFSSSGSSENKEGKVDMKGLMMHHILDSHDWHITDIPGSWFGRSSDIPVEIHLPWFFYNRTEGKCEFFPSSEKLLESGKYIVHHEHVYAKLPVSQDSPETSQVESNFDKSVSILDFSITKTSLHLLFITLLVFLVFTSIAKSYKKRPVDVPKGAQSFFEPIIVFVRDDIAKPNLGEKAEKFLPLLLCFFFLIWFSNLFGMIPINTNIMGNISVTVSLAIITFILTQINASKDYWKHIFWYPGAPLPLKFLIMVVEFIGLFTKPFALTVRLFANIAAGHFMILGLVGLFFIIKFAAIPITIPFVLFISALELLVGIVQAYVFTLLSSIFIGAAMVSHSGNSH